jgi:hypothetical protein
VVVSSNSNGMCSKPVWGTRCYTPREAVTHILKWLYQGENTPRDPINNSIPKKTSRNEEIRERYENGEPVPSLAERFGISKAQVYQIPLCARVGETTLVQRLV